MSRTQQVGGLGEQAAAELLLNKGYEIVDRNFRSRYGEIDIIAVLAQYIVFVEVKTRKAQSMASGMEAVDRKKQRKIVKTAMQYLSEHQTNLQPRFDVISVVTKNNGSAIGPLIHLENAFSVEVCDEAF